MERTRRRWGLWIVVAVLLAVVAYPLSVGPLMYFARADHFPAWMETPAVSYFLPLHWFLVNAAPEPVVAWFFAYCEWWVNL